MFPRTLPHLVQNARPLSRPILPNILRSTSSTAHLIRRQSTLENILAPPLAALSVAQITSSGVELSDGLVLRGPAILLNGRAFLWDPPPAGGSWKGWGKETWGLLEVVVPRPEILLFGTGRSLILPPPSVRTYLNEMGIQVDFMDTRNACSTYNLLLEEGRRVAAALLPLNKHVPWLTIPRDEA
ncbi:DUF498-domain-containing protein [Dacryopinax primogenitus]|uniref:NADH dehydrogenase [ubiquinone] 1 alpha subcomplex assembly factor 3 n=1 Tax=Dacryopinax primogenitus (strain DJM 731) TaxID=1858805 RepID=M5GC51_DACPD|nr:DUF498-domain-containing protein [Dacryopinax primogenitus]EJU06604.1 DUF498-domain-containing protein [Dacryopinax primogenitus]